METILIYILKWVLCLAVLYIPFTLLLRKESFASLNRKLLLCMIIVSALLPAVVIRFTVELPETAATYKNQPLAAEEINTLLTTSAHRDIFTWENIAILYFAGVVTVLAWGVAGAAKTISRIKRGTLWQDKQDGITIHCHANDTAPFSWFEHIVISENDYNECGTEILLHEKGHIHHKHSYDMLLIEVVKALQWFNPFIYMLENDLKELHEYEADRYVLQNYTDTQAYQLLILRKSLGSKSISLVNNFGTSSVRKRIMMMARKEEPSRLRRAKWCYLAPMASLLMLFFAEPEYIYTTPAREAIANATPITTPQTKMAAAHKKEEKNISAQAETPKARKQKQIANIPVTAKTVATESTPELSATTIPAATTETETETDTGYAHETYYEYKELKGIADGDTNIKKCSVRMQFTAGNSGKATNITPKGCNISMSMGNNNSSTIEEIQNRIIAATTQYIESKEWKLATIDGKAINTNYDAHIIFHDGTSTAITANSTKRPLLIGSTPIY